MLYMHAECFFREGRTRTQSEACSVGVEPRDWFSRQVCSRRRFSCAGESPDRAWGREERAALEQRDGSRALPPLRKMAPRDASAGSFSCSRNFPETPLRLAGRRERENGASQPADAGVDILADSSHHCTAFMGICHLCNTNSSQMAAEGRLPRRNTESVRHSSAKPSHKPCSDVKISTVVFRVAGMSCEKNLNSKIARRFTKIKILKLLK